jgi:hypothetical protein
MVNLKVGQSSFDAKTQPFTHKWDLSMRQYYQTYQHYIDQSHYRLQKALKGLPIFGTSNFPGHFQHKYLMLELYQKKQLLGEVEDSEVEAYAKQHPTIREDLGFTFSPHK